MSDYLPADCSESQLDEHYGDGLGECDGCGRRVMQTWPCFGNALCERCLARRDREWGTLEKEAEDDAT